MTRLYLPFPPKELSPNARADRWLRARKVRQYRDECWVVGRQARGANPSGFPLPTPVHASVTFVVTTNRKRDEDNLAASIKALWDGLVDAKVLSADDSKALHIAEVSIRIGKKAAVEVELS